MLANSLGCHFYRFFARFNSHTGSMYMLEMTENFVKSNLYHKITLLKRKKKITVFMRK